MQGEPGGGRPQGLGGGGTRLDDEAYARGGGVDELLYGGEVGVPAGGGAVEPLGGHGDAGELRQHGAQRPGGLALGRQEPAQVAAQLSGQCEQGDGVVQGREVDDGQVRVGVGCLAEGLEEGVPVAAGEFGELLAVEPGRAEQFEGGGGVLLEGEEFGAEVGAGVDAPDVEPVLLRQPVDRVAAHEQDLAALAGGGEGGGGGVGGTAGAARPGDEEHAHSGTLPVVRRR